MRAWSIRLVTVLLALGVVACSDYDRARSAFEGGDYAKAFERYTVLAEAGDVRAQYDLSQMYFQGVGGQGDTQRAWHWLLTSADGGNVAAMVKLGSIYENGVGASRDNASAAQWYLRAARRGDPIGRFNLASLYLKGIGVPRDEVAALAWFRMALKAGGPAARSWADQLERRLTAEELARVDQIVEQLEAAEKE
ncbi:MAG: tetratricopeptide repeat protein [Hydrogenophaga sp.]|uniref:tetratricopeptide repeat protein n=1 Tax=Hydrogenophaga sp. TaxID=1904254 RepID=UPI0026372A30|nr:tetratricopeptide repeat protein [Hydrogenophaga sp.]MDM7942436.1 tetratricopeptide repeat protein [Hydrogenophaga sp.]